jgi:hypothetical protein
VCATAEQVPDVIAKGDSQRAHEVWQEVSAHGILGVPSRDEAAQMG